MIETEQEKVQADRDQKVVDLAEFVHRAAQHDHGVCHGNNDECSGGPSTQDYDTAEEALAYLEFGAAIDNPPEPQVGDWVVYSKPRLPHGRGPDWIANAWDRRRSEPCLVVAKYSRPNQGESGVECRLYEHREDSYPDFWYAPVEDLKVVRRASYVKIGRVSGG